MKRGIRARLLVTLVAVASSLPALALPGQGCEPIRFTTPVSLGCEGQAYQPSREWQVTVAYRRLVSNEWFVGTEESSRLAPGGTSPVFRIHTVVGGVTYAFTDRFRLGLSVPFSTGSFTRVWPDGARHEQTARGIGDVTLLGEAWMLAPRAHERGNVSLGLGVKAPTGSHTVGDKFYAASGAVDYPADQTIQPGDGGWAVILQAQGFRQLTDRLYGYGFASYMASPRSESDVRTIPTTGPYWSVPDVYSVRLGAAFSVLPDQGLSVSLGARADGIPVRDLLGGGDATTAKRSAFILYADPGVSFTRGPGTFTASVPSRSYVNRRKSVLEQRTNGLNAGGFAKYLVFLSYAHRL